MLSFKMGQPRPLFRSFSVFSNKLYDFYIKYTETESRADPIDFQCERDENKQKEAGIGPYLEKMQKSNYLK